jgi:hypothetical protein
MILYLESKHETALLQFNIDRSCAFVGIEIMLYLNL